MNNRYRIATAIPVALLALGLGACNSQEDPQMMDQPAMIDGTPDNDPATGDPTRVDRVDAYGEDQPVPMDRPPTFEEGMPPTEDPTDEQVPPPDPEDAGDPVDP